MKQHPYYTAPIINSSHRQGAAPILRPNRLTWVEINDPNHLILLRGKKGWANKYLVKNGPANFWDDTARTMISDSTNSTYRKIQMPPPTHCCQCAVHAEAASGYASFARLVASEAIWT